MLKKVMIDSLYVSMLYLGKRNLEILYKRKDIVVTLNQLIYFQTVATLENYHKAAEKLFISQPSLSRAMASLEEELGITLFKKEGRGVVLTKAGRLFLEHANIILADCNVAVDKMTELSGGGGKIDIGYVFPLAGHYIPHKVRKFLEQSDNEKVVFNFWQNHTPAIAAKVKSGELDVGFGGWLDKPYFDYYPLINQELVIVTPVSKGISDDKELPLTVLSSYPVIGYDKDSWMGTHQCYLYKKYGIKPNIIVECPDEYSILALVKEDFGFALMPRTDILENNPGVNVHRIKGLDICHQVFMFWKKDTYHLPAVERFIEYMKGQADPQTDSFSLSKIYLKDIVNY